MEELGKCQMEFDVEIIHDIDVASDASIYSDDEEPVTRYKKISMLKTYKDQPELGIGVEYAMLKISDMQ